MVEAGGDKAMTIDFDALRGALINYYGSGIGVNFLMAVSGIEEIRSASTHELLEMAEECGIDINNFIIDIDDR